MEKLINTEELRKRLFIAKIKLGIPIDRVPTSK